MMDEIRHIVFNPTSDDVLPFVCENQQAEGFALFQVVSYHSYAFVAIFQHVLSDQN